MPPCPDERLYTLRAEYFFTQPVRPRRHLRYLMVWGHDVVEAVERATDLVERTPPSPLPDGVVTLTSLRLVSRG
jgi:hypothetical protein